MTKQYVSLFTFALLFFAPAAHAVEVQEVVTPKGIHAWLVEEHALPLFSLQIAFTEAGTAHDPAGKEGRADFTSDLLLEGAGDMNALQFHEALENHAIHLSAQAGADTFTVALESLSEHRDTAFSLLGAILTQPRFDAEAITRVRAQALSQLKQLEQSPNYALQRGWQQAAFGAHPYGRPGNGTEQSLASLQATDFKAVMQHLLARQNMLIGVVGDITPEALAAALDASLASLPAAYTPEGKVEEVRLPAGSTAVVIPKDIPQTLVAFGTNGVKREDPRYFAAYVMNYILGGDNLTARLVKAIREERGLAYYASTSLEPMQHAALLTGTFATRNDQVGAAIEAMRATVKDFVEKGITDKELADAKQYLTGSFLLSLDSNSEVASVLIAMQRYHLGRDYLNKRNALLNAVTRQNAERMARELLDPAKLIVIMVGKPEGIHATAAP